MSEEYAHPNDYLHGSGWEEEVRDDPADYVPVPSLYHKNFGNMGCHNQRYEKALIIQLLRDVEALGGLRWLREAADEAKSGK